MIKTLDRLKTVLAFALAPAIFSFALAIELFYPGAYGDDKWSRGG